MIKKIQKFFNGIKNLNKTNNYKVIKNIDELFDILANSKQNIIDKLDLSNLDLREYEHLFVGQLANRWNPAKDKDGNKIPDIITAWTDRIIWPAPEKMPAGFNPQKILEDQKKQSEMAPVHKIGKTGKNIGIAIIDQRLNLEHPEYVDNIKHYEAVGDWPGNNTTSPDEHGSLVTGCAVGKTTGTAPDADLYYFAANNWKDEKNNLPSGHDTYILAAINKIIETNKTLDQSKKIRLISCSLSIKEENYKKALTACKDNGIMLSTCNQSSTLSFIQSHLLPYDTNYPTGYQDKIGIPTDGKTTPYYSGGYIYRRSGGNSSTIPYITGVFACALQDNTIFCTRPNWQDELIEIMKETATQNEHGEKIINPLGIESRVSEIARTMEAVITKQQSALQK